VKGAGAVVWSVGLAERWSGVVGLARWAGARGGGAAGDAGMGRVVARLLVALGWWLAGWGESEREGETKGKSDKERERKVESGRERENG
jgi:hypothetical protein